MQPIYADREMGGRTYKHIVGYGRSLDYTKYGSKIGTPGAINTGVAWDWVGSNPISNMGIQVVLENRSGTPLRATDAQYYAPSNY